MQAYETRSFSVAETRVANALGVRKDARITFERNVPATMRDGVQLATNVFRPEAPGRYPVIISMAPYGKDLFPADDDYNRIPNTGLVRVSEWVVFEAPDPVFWVPHGYVVVMADLRATNQSGGDHFKHFSPQMAEDFYDLVEWAASQPWSDGNVGSNGVSYLAVTQWLGAALQPPHLKAMIPWEGWTDPYREHAFHGGMPDVSFFRLLWKRGMDPNVGWVAKGATSEDMVAEQEAHPLLDDFWRARAPDLSRITVPAYVATSWATAGTHLRGSIEGFKQIASEHKWLEIHGRKEWEYYYSRECLERQRRFFDQFLKGIDTGMHDLPRVRVEVRDRFYEGQFRFADNFPLPGAEYRKLFLDPAQGALLADAPAAPSSLRYSAVKSTSEPDRAEFSITFDEATALVGYVKLRLWVSAEGADDMDLHVGLKKFDRRGQEVVFPDFNHMEDGMAGVGWLRASHRELDPARTTPHQPWHTHARLLPLADGEIVPLDIEIWPTGVSFHAGETLKLIVQGYEILNFIYRYRHDETVNAGHHVLHTGGPYDSHLLVPVIPAG